MQRNLREALFLQVDDEGVPIQQVLDDQFVFFVIQLTQKHQIEGLVYGVDDVDASVTVPNQVGNKGSTDRCDVDWLRNGGHDTVVGIR